MPNKNITKEWLEGEVTITREELGEIIAKETHTVIKTAIDTGTPKELCMLLLELLTEFGATVATRIFEKTDYLENKDF